MPLRSVLHHRHDGIDWQCGSSTTATYCTPNNGCTVSFACAVYRNSGGSWGSPCPGFGGSFFLDVKKGTCPPVSTAEGMQTTWSEAQASPQAYYMIAWFSSAADWTNAPCSQFAYGGAKVPDQWITATANGQYGGSTP